MTEDNRMKAGSREQHVSARSIHGSKRPVYMSAAWLQWDFRQLATSARGDVVARCSRARSHWQVSRHNAE